MNFVLRKPLTIGRAARIIASFTVSVTIIAGMLIHFTDQKNFPNVGDGLWWAVQTVTTVGYGDLVPTSTPGRLVAALVMLAGIGFLTVIKAARSKRGSRAAVVRTAMIRDELARGSEAQVATAQGSRGHTPTGGASTYELQPTSGPLVRRHAQRGAERSARQPSFATSE